MEKGKWLVINYNLPTEPSRLRVATWRSLKKLGAVNIQQSMWVLPHNDDNYSALQAISQEIEVKNGEVLLMQCEFLNLEHEDKVIAYFNKARDEEYKEFIDKCEDYFKEIEKEIAIEKFTFAEVEEEEEELDKLLSWYGKIEARDIFHSLKRDCAKGKLDQVKKAFENYSDMVYQYTILRVE
ncbi:Chromate resistance protein ChrB [Desulfosporosinus sp.]|uniref:Chromate resistance protein ChrB n=1 Tax=Desulfosporosinus sp. TaxID=157907 RepID=UPI002325C9AE|nr:Chromate resistance protein ChrB [Desulfosporosinus sp.]MCO5384584.1 chromate resistance protein ChrB [Desulfosporosinus sp.]MDA8220240.1 chromate resistance protein ChrB [Desulfitobacterium hafniense]